MKENTSLTSKLYCILLLFSLLGFSQNCKILLKREGSTLKVFTNTNKLIYDARTKEYELLEVSINDFPLRFESRHYVKGFYSNFNKKLRIE
ncbi:hypothetical protein BWG23_11505 [Flavobacterium oreochromis]|nr:hypothetical protein BWG23_11505 [Flavobacterium oreochromis]